MHSEELRQSDEASPHADYCPQWVNERLRSFDAERNAQGPCV